MPRYKVQTYGTAIYHYEVEAESKAEAEEIVWEAGQELNDGCPVDIQDERIESIEELEENENGTR